MRIRLEGKSAMKQRKTFLRGHFFMLIVFIVGSLTLWGGLSSASAQMVRVRVAYSTLGAIVLPVWITREASLDRKYGLDTELVFLRGGTTTTQALLSKSVEFAILSGTSMTLANLGGADLVIVGTYHNKLNFKIIARPEIGAPKDLVGKKIGVQSFTGASVFAARVGLHKLGVNPRDVQFVAMGDNQGILSGMESKALMAGSISDPQGLLAQKLGFRVLHDFLKSDLPFANISVITRREYVSAHEEIVTRLLKAQMEGVRYLLSHPDRAKKTISQYARIRDPEILDYTLRLFSGSYNPSLMPEPEGMKTVYEGLADQRPETKNLDPSAYIYDSTIKKIHQSSFPGELDRLYPGTRQ